MISNNLKKYNIMKLTEERLNKNYATFTLKLKEVGVDIDTLVEELGDKLKTATYALNEDSGVAYDGALIQHLMYKVIKYALAANKTLPEEMMVDEQSIFKVIFLHQIAKAIMFEENDVDWQIKKGSLYKFSELPGALRCGERSLFLCSKYGIKLTEEETEAMRVKDKDFDTDDYVKVYKSPLSLIVKFANDVADTEARVSYKNSLKK
jgi:hypothetical protein